MFTRLFTQENIFVISTLLKQSRKNLIYANFILSIARLFQKSNGKKYFTKNVKNKSFRRFFVFKCKKIKYTLITSAQRMHYGVPSGYTLITSAQRMHYGVPFGYTE